MNNSFFIVWNGFQSLRIPRSGRYRFEVIGAGSRKEEPGARIIGEIRLEKGEAITVALGQQGSHPFSGNGGTFVVKQNGTSDPQPLFVAGGAGCATHRESDFGKASLSQTASGNDKIGSSGIQEFLANDENLIFCGGAGFLERPVTGRLREDSVVPKYYKFGLIGGKGIDPCGDLVEGGFGGGGAMYTKNRQFYWGAGGGYTGGGTKIYDHSICDGGGGGSFSIDKEAQFDHAQEGNGKCTITYLD